MTSSVTIAVCLVSIVGMVAVHETTDRRLTYRNVTFFFKENSIDLETDSAWCMSWYGRPSCLGELDTLAAILMADTTLVIEIGGHADATERSHDSIANARAQFIREALMARSIHPARLKAVSYGASGPWMAQDRYDRLITEKERADARRMNRRVVSKLISFDHRP